MSVLQKIIKLIVFKCIDFLIWPPKKTGPKTILLLRLDAIGDYILFRNFIEILSKSEKYKGYRVTLLGNQIWESIARELDGKFIDRFIWLDIKRFGEDYRYRYQFLKEITSVKYEIIINPEYSRRFWDTDWIVKKVSANQKIGNDGNLSNRKKWQKQIGDSYYTKLIPSSPKLLFEFYRNKEFFEKILDIDIQLKKTQITPPAITSNLLLPTKFVILFLGSSTTYSKWPVKKFAQIAKYVKLELGLEIVICGGPIDIDNANEFKIEYRDSYFDFVGKTTLVELVIILSHASLLISNETSAPHFAVALGIPTIVIYNGNHFGRFTPYPSDMTSKYAVVCHPSIEQNFEAYKLLSNKCGYSSTLDINKIEVQQVIDEINKVYSNNS